MGADDQDEVWQIVSEALDVDEAEREVYAARACGGNAALREEVLALLGYSRDPRALVAIDEPVAAEVAAVPERIGRYEIVRKIGEGGMGVVYEAQQQSPARRVALKVMRKLSTTESLQRRFELEATLLGSLQHPNIAHVYEAGTFDLGDGPQAFFAMELVEGRPLTTHAEKDGLSRRQRLELMACLCDAVHHAHQRMVIHRDLKPDNILVTADGQPKILDFGTARPIGRGDRALSHLTLPGQMVGTLAYMSPEQVSGTRDGVATSTDVYSLGVICYELLSGRLPHDFSGASLTEAVRTITERDPEPLGTLDASLRGDVDTIVAKALARDRDQRYASAAELAADIRRFLAGEPIVARPPSWRYLAGRFIARHPWGVSFASMTAVALVLATVFSIVQMRDAQQARRVADRQKRVALIEACRANLAAAKANLEASNMWATQQALDRIPLSERHWEWHYLRSQLDCADAVVDTPASVAAALEPDAGRLVTVSPDGTVRWLDPFLGRVSGSTALDLANIQRVELSADGRRMGAIHGPDARHVGLWKLDPDRGCRRLVDTELDDAGIDLALSADGTTIAATSANIAYIWQPASAAPVRWAHRMQPRGIAISADGKRVGLVGSADGMGVYRLFEVSKRGATLNLGRDIGSLALSPDGSLVATGENDGVVRLRRAMTGSVRRRLALAGGAPRIVVFEADGHGLATAGRDGTIRLWDLDSPRPTGVLAGYAASIRQLGFGAGGSHLVSLDDSGTARLWNLAGRRGPLILRGHRSGVIAVAVFPDGSRIVSGSADGDLRFWHAASGECYAAVPDPTSEMASLSVSPDGSRIATTHRGEVLVRDAGTLGVQRRLATGAREVVALSFAPDSRRLAVLGSSGRTTVWDLADGTSFQMSAARSPDGDVAFSPSGGRVATGHEGELIVRHAVTGKRLHSFRVPRATAHAVTWIPRTAFVASGWSDGAVRLLDTSTGSVDVLRASHEAVLAIAPSPDGSRIAAGSRRGVIAIWDVATACLTIELRPHGGPITSLAFSRDGSSLIAGSADATLRVWESSPVHERRSAAARVAALGKAMQGYVRKLFERLPDPLQVAELLWRDPTLTEPRKRAALCWTLHPPMPDSGLQRDPFDGYALDFAGADQHVSVSDGSQALRMSDAFTIEAWIRPGAAEPFVEGARLSLRTIINKEGEYQIAAMPDGELHWILADPDGWMPWVPVRYAAPPDRWTHVALVRDSAQMRFYVNGRRVQTRRGPERIGDHHPTMNELRIGGRQHTPSSFVGQIDEVRIWSAARSDEQIRSSMRRRLAGTEPGLLSAWSFDEGRGSIARELTGRHPGAIVGPSWHATSIAPR